jgi:ABC-2 type transport system ATP-binding protein
MLHISNFTKSYGKLPVLKIGDLAVDVGIYWVRGVNGSGKSTLLKSLAGLIYFEGDVVLNELSIKSNATGYRQLVNYAEAEPLFPEFLTGSELIELFKSAKIATPHQEQYLVESFRMEGYINEPVGTYSSGMLKKLSLVLAFIGNPTLILLDEPTITLDTESLIVLSKLIAERYHEHNTSFLISSHQSLELKEVAVQQIVVENNTINLPL